MLQIVKRHIFVVCIIVKHWSILILKASVISNIDNVVCFLL